MNIRQTLLGIALLPLFACVAAPEGDTTSPPGSAAAPGDGDASEQAAAVAAKTVSYAVDDASIFANPERGFYHHLETHADGYAPLSKSELQGFRLKEAISLVLRMFYLDSFRDADISASYLDHMREDFATARAAGVKLVVRFAYTDSADKPYGDASKARVLGHLAQLAPVLEANADVIATVQAGLIGAWGEWYYTDFFGDQGSISAAQWSDRKAIVDALLAILPSTRAVQLRTPAFKQRLYGAGAVAASEAFTSAPKARVGHHNDCFLASADDVGTYGDVAADKAYLAADNLFVPQGGETCATSSFSGWANASADMARLHYSFLNRDYRGAVYDSWGANLDVARRRLGYRLALVDSALGARARPGGEVSGSLRVRNDGYAAPFNPRGLEIIAKNRSTGARLVAAVPADPRRFAPASTQSVALRLCVPEGTPEGVYDLSLALPDPEPSLHDRPEYAIRLANMGLWDAQAGDNSLKRTLTVDASAAAPPCSQGSARLEPK